MDTTETTPATRHEVAAWFEIPSVDFDRAQRFYATLLDVTVFCPPVSPRMGIIKYRPDAGGGAIVERGVPSADGVTFFFQVNDRLDATAARIEAAGGRLLGPIVDIAPNGRMQLFLDTEGNRLGLHSER